MRVLTVVCGMGIGGTERVALNMSLGLAAEGADVAVLAYREGGPRESAYRAAGLPVFIRSGPHEDRMVEAARRWNPDIIHIHRSGYADAQETRLLRHLRSGRTKIVETNVFARFDWSEGGRLIDAHCNLTKWCAYKWHMWGGWLAKTKPSYVLPNPIDTDSIPTPDEATRQHVRTTLGIPPGRFVFGRVGRPTMAKWSPVILTAFQEVLQRHDIGLLLIGSPPELAKMIAGLPDEVRDRIIQVPSTAQDEHLYRLIGAMDGFLHASFIGESFGMVLCEAMVAGVPVVTLSTPLKDNGQLEVVGHEQGGLVALSPSAMPEAMDQLVTGEALRRNVKKSGRQWVANRFGIKVVTCKALRIYQSMLSGFTAHSAIDDDDIPPDWTWLQNVLSLGIGRPGMDQRTATIFKLLHNPEIYNAYMVTRPLLKRMGVS